MVILNKCQFIRLKHVRSFMQLFFVGITNLLNAFKDRSREVFAIGPSQGRVFYLFYFF